MKQARYLNGILTINAFLLAGVLWVNVADRGVFANEAYAEPPRVGLPDAASQRQKMIKELQGMREDIRAMRKHLESSESRVRVTSMPPVRVEGGN